jgi:hypothetical protein
MVYKPECVTCRFLQVCKRTSHMKILSHFVCESFEEVESELEVVKARCDIINMFGAAGIQALAPHSEAE